MARDCTASTVPLRRRVLTKSRCSATAVWTGDPGAEPGEAAWVRDRQRYKAMPTTASATAAVMMTLKWTLDWDLLGGGENGPEGGGAGGATDGRSISVVT
jgi:hypothetical protein